MNSLSQSNKTHGSSGGTAGSSDHSSNSWLTSLLATFTLADGTLTTSSSSSESGLWNPIEGAIHSARDAISNTGKALLRTPTKVRLNRSRTGVKTTRPCEMTAVGEEDEDVEVDEGEPEQRGEVSSSSESQSSPIVNIRSGMDGAEVELIPEDSTPLSNSPGSSFFIAPSSIEAVSMKLTVLRGRDLPFERSRVRISVIDPEDRLKDDLLGLTPTEATGHNPLWGGPSCSWPIVGTQTTQLLFVVTDHEAELDSSSSLALSSDSSNGQSQGSGAPDDATAPATTKGKSIVFAKVLVRDLLDGGIQRNPNFWIKLTDYGTTGIAFCGRIQVRLTRPIAATVHKQENCPKITPGPNFPRLQSYAIRNLALYSCTPVILNVYDVSNNPRVMRINNTMKSIGYGGIFHAAVEINGREYSFGGTQNKKSNVTGVFTTTPKKCPMHNYRESVYLGDCELNAKQIQGILQDLRPRWKANTYNLFRKNCAFFSREFAIELGVGDIPPWVYSLASTAEFIEPYASKLNNYLHPRTTAATTTTTNNNNNTKVSPLSKQKTNEGGGGRSPIAGAKPGLSEEDAKELSAILDSEQTKEAQNAATCTQESLLDHAMAVRIQRSIRATNSRRSLSVCPDR
jgi:hypothetical protein